MSIIQSSLIKTRADFGRVCDLLHYRNGVEIGCDLAYFSDQILKTSEFLYLYVVDPWLPYEEMPWNREQALEEALERLSKYQQQRRCTVIRGTSTQAVNFIPDPVSFVYIDGSHSYDHVVEDLRIWYEKLQRGGMLAGHDFDYDPVRMAVIDSFPGRTIHVIPEYSDTVCQGEHPSFYLFKR